MSAAGAEDEPADPSDRFDARGVGDFAARGIGFGCLATAALVLPGALGLDLMPVGTPAGPLDGGVAVLLVLGVLCFGWPPPGRRRAAGALLDLAAGAACVHLFLVLALCAGAQVPGAPSDVAGGTHGWLTSIGIASAWAHAGVAAWIAGGCAVALVFLGRLGGAAGVGAVVTLPVALAAGLQGGSDAAAPGVEVELVPVQLELRGPLAPTVLRVGDAPPLEVSADLGPGATRWVRAWIPARVDRVPGPLEPVALGGALGLSERPAWNPPEGLIGRRRPPLSPVARRVAAVAELLGAWGGLALLLGIRASLGRRRPVGAALACLALGGAAGVPLASAAAAVPAEAPGLRILEGVRGVEDRWVQVDRRRGGLRCDASGSEPAAILVDGAGLLGCRLESTEQGDRFEVRARPDTVLDLVRPISPGLRVLQERLNGWGALDRSFVLEGGEWRGPAPWPKGSAAPGVRDEPGGQSEPGGRAGAGGTIAPSGDPGESGPGGASGLPPWARSGASGAAWAVVGLLEEGAYRGLEGPEASPADLPCWLRLVDVRP